MPQKAYAVHYKKSVDKDLRRLPQDVRSSIVERIQSLATNPFPAQSTKLRGSIDLYRLRFTNYRIIYQVDGDKLVVLVIKVGHRKEVYREICNMLSSTHPCQIRTPTKSLQLRRLLFVNDIPM